MPNIYHIDLSNKFWKDKTTGIACVEAESKWHIGCALGNRIKRYIERKLYKYEDRIERAKLYAICIYYLTKDEKIGTLVICCDENFSIVKHCLLCLFDKSNTPLKIISIIEFRKILGRSIRSPADNYARAYAKRGLKQLRWNTGTRLNVVEITYSMIKEKWEKIKNVSE